MGSGNGADEEYAVTKMTRAEIGDIQRMINNRYKLQKQMAKERAAQQKAEIQEQVSSVFNTFDNDSMWSKLAKIATDATGKAQAEISEECQKLGIPPQFVPIIKHPDFFRVKAEAQGDRNMAVQRGYARIEVSLREALGVIEAQKLQAEQELYSHTLTSQTAIQFMENMKSAEELMPLPRLNPAKLLAPRQTPGRERASVSYLTAVDTDPYEDEKTDD